MIRGIKTNRLGELKMKYYSELTDKIYNTEDELKAAEKALADEKAKKEAAAKEKKADAIKVETAFKARNAARRKYNSELVEARKAYNDAILAAEKNFRACVEKISKAKDDAEKAYDEALKTFTAAHKEGYHLKLTDGDNVVVLSSNPEAQLREQIAKRNSDFFEKFFDLLKF
jgi:hypothetical protein